MEKYVLFRIKPGKSTEWHDWCTFLRTKKDEIGVLLGYEGILREVCVEFPNFILGYINAFPNNEVADMNIELNRKHKDKINECLEIIGRGDILYDFE